MDSVVAHTTDNGVDHRSWRVPSAAIHPADGDLRYIVAHTIGSDINLNGGRYYSGLNHDALCVPRAVVRATVLYTLPAVV